MTHVVEPVRVDLALSWCEAISHTLEAAGLTSHEQLMCLLGVCAIVVAYVPAEERELVRKAHIAAVDRVLEVVDGEPG